MTKAKVVPISLAPDPYGRLDVLLSRLAEAGVRWGERKIRRHLGLSVNLWDGPDGVGQVITDAIAEYNIPAEPLTPRMLARRAGFVGKKRRAS